jgi:hypothetical protein
MIQFMKERNPVVKRDPTVLPLDEILWQNKTEFEVVNQNEILCHKLCVVSSRSRIVLKTVKRLIILQLKDGPLLYLIVLLLLKV